VKLKWQVHERDDGYVDLMIVNEDGEVDVIAVHLPPLGPRQELIDAAIRSVVYNRRARFEYEHARLRVQIDELRAGLTREERAAPPMLAELFISFLAPKNSAQGLLGDLQEMFQKNAERYGTKQARRKYWIEVGRSFGPLLWQWLKRIGFFTVLIDYFRAKFGL
jgi:hypothetical protein